MGVSIQKFNPSPRTSAAPVGGWIFPLHRLWYALLVGYGISSFNLRSLIRLTFWCNVISRLGMKPKFCHILLLVLNVLLMDCNIFVVLDLCLFRFVGGISVVLDRDRNLFLCRRVPFLCNCCKRLGCVMAVRSVSSSMDC